MTHGNAMQNGLAIGCRSGNMVKVNCRLDDATFQQVRDLAAKERTSFAEQIRKLVEWGLEADTA